MRLALFVLLLAALPVRAQQTDVLFIGNSYTATNDLPNLFRQIALSLGDTVNTTMQAPGGYTLANHLFDPATQNAIASQQWDYVVLQEQSLRRRTANERDLQRYRCDRAQLRHPGEQRMRVSGVLHDLGIRERL
jgi:hypothetical protein